jgi:predicted nucleotidyltransferase
VTYSLSQALAILKEHQTELRERGVTHAAVFGSVAPGEADVTSDVDILIDLDPEPRIDLFDYVNIKLHIAALFGVDSIDGPIDVVNRRTLKPLLRQQVISEAVDAF